MQNKTDDAASQKMNADLKAKIDSRDPDAISDEGGAPEVPEGAAKDKGDITPDRENNASELEQQLQDKEEERKRLARINAKTGEKAKHYQVAAVDAIAKLPPEQAQEMLDENPDFLESFNERHPDFFKSSEETVKEPAKETPASDKSDSPEKVQSEDVLVAKAMAKISLAAKEQEEQSQADVFGAQNSLNQEDSNKLKKVASAITAANTSVSYQDALKSAYELEYGKPPTDTPVITDAARENGQGPMTSEDAQFWDKQFNLKGDAAKQAHKGAEDLYKSMKTSSTSPRK